jgi:hypothetical protein
MSLVSEIVVLVIAAWIIFRMPPESVGRPLSSVADDQARKVVSEVFNSEYFLSALRTSLPKGEKDVEHGLDYIPFMLDSIAGRRKTFQKSSNVFFWTTMVVGSIFAAIVTGVGWLLLNEAAAGTPMQIAEFAAATNKLNDTLQKASPEWFRIQLDKTESEGIDRLKELRLTENAGLLRERAQELLHTPDVQSILQGLTREISEIPDDATPGEIGVRGELQRIVERLTQLLKANNSALGEARQAAADLRVTVAKAKEFGQENQLGEIVRRVAIGTIVGTFFFAILRYIAGLYRKDYEQVRQAYADDLALRKFYVAYKSASGTERELAISFLVSKGNEAPKEGEAELGISKAESDLLRELLKSVSKRLE